MHGLPLFGKRKGEGGEKGIMRNKKTDGDGRNDSE